jgi:hypothetical protein
MALPLLGACVKGWFEKYSGPQPSFLKLATRINKVVYMIKPPVSRFERDAREKYAGRRPMSVACVGRELTIAIG